jgi:hypothetical protein
MKIKGKGYENYPIWIVLIYNFILVSIYAIGLYLTYLIHLYLFIAFIALIIYSEASVYMEGCRNCYYYGKTCGTGRGRIVKLIMKKGSPKKFCEKKVTGEDFLVHMLPSIVIVIGGIYLMIRDFSWLILLFTAWPVIVWFGNQWLYGELLCPNCKQCAICCPVAEFFKEMEMKKKKKK